MVHFDDRKGHDEVLIVQSCFTKPILLFLIFISAGKLKILNDDKNRGIARDVYDWSDNE